MGARGQPMVGTVLLGASSASACIFNERHEGRSSARRQTRRTAGCRFRTATFICVSNLCMLVHTNVPSIKLPYNSEAIYSRMQRIVRDRREEEGQAMAEVAMRVHREIRRSINGHNEVD